MTTAAHQTSRPGIVIYGPQGCGKTRHAYALANHFGLAFIDDDWMPGDPIQADTLALTNEQTHGAIAFVDAIAAAGIRLTRTDWAAA